MTVIWVVLGKGRSDPSYLQFYGAYMFKGQAVARVRKLRAESKASHDLRLQFSYHKMPLQGEQVVSFEPLITIKGVKEEKNG